MFRPNKTCFIQKVNGRDRYGQESLAAKIKARCSIVRLGTKSEKTSVRADSSASRGGAEEEQSYAVILLERSANVDINDVITIAETSTQVTDIKPRYNIQGRLDHFQIQGKAWQSN